MTIKGIVAFEKKHRELTEKAQTDDSYLPEFGKHLLEFMQKASNEVGKICPVSRSTAPVYAAVFYRLYKTIFADLDAEGKEICKGLVEITKDVYGNNTVSFEVPIKE